MQWNFCKISGNSVQNTGTGVLFSQAALLYQGLGLQLYKKELSLKKKNSEWSPLNTLKFFWKVILQNTCYWTPEHQNTLSSVPFLTLNMYELGWLRAIVFTFFACRRYLLGFFVYCFKQLMTSLSRIVDVIVFVVKIVLQLNNSFDVFYHCLFI